jgi:hypothetical protein
MYLMLRRLSPGKEMLGCFDSGIGSGITGAAKDWIPFGTPLGQVYDSGLIIRAGTNAARYAFIV